MSLRIDLDRVKPNLNLYNNHMETRQPEFQLGPTQECFWILVSKDRFRFKDA